MNIICDDYKGNVILDIALERINKSIVNLFLEK